jgi:hypothetical protein
MGMEQATGAAGLKLVEAVARGRLDGLLEKHLAEPQQQVIKGTIGSADRQKVVERQAGCWPSDLDDGSAQRPVIAAQDGPEAEEAFRSNCCGFNGTVLSHR